MATYQWIDPSNCHGTSDPLMTSSTVQSDCLLSKFILMLRFYVSITMYVKKKKRPEYLNYDPRL